MVTHDNRIFSAADRIVNMVDGRIAAISQNSRREDSAAHRRCEARAAWRTGSRNVRSLADSAGRALQPLASARPAVAPAASAGSAGGKSLEPGRGDPPDAAQKQ